MEPVNTQLLLFCLLLEDWSTHQPGVGVSVCCSLQHNSALAHLCCCCRCCCGTAFLD